jgi:nicotinamidase-related amidase
MSEEKTFRNDDEEDRTDLDNLISEIALQGSHNLEEVTSMSEEKSEIGTAGKKEIIIPDQLRERLGIRSQQEVIREALSDYIAKAKEKGLIPDQQEVAVALALEPRRTAIVVIDLQKGIIGIPGGAPHTKPAVIANTVRLLTAARAAGAQPILVHVGGSPDGADRLHTPTDQPMRVTGPLPPDWSEFIPELDRQPSDIVILKRQWGAFYGTDLDLQLRRRNLAAIILCGISTEAGVESTARDAYERGYELIFAEDAMTSSSAESHANSVQRIFPRMGRVRSTDEILAALS